MNQGVKFNDRYATRNGYTLIGLFDENKNPWNSNFTHPGGETDTAVKVYAKYLEGDYTVVRTATELKIAANGNNNIYIANDIDMQGESLSFKNFTKEFLGNNCTISNFVLSYSSTKDSLVSDYEDNSKNSLSISLFGDTNGAKICDVNFTGVTVDVDAKTYTVVKPMVDVAFDAGDKAAVATVNTNKNIGIQLPVPANDQFVFRGWYVDEACETAVTLVDGKYVPTASVTLYAKWDAKVTLTIVYGNGMANGVYDYGADDALDMEQYKPAGANNKFFEGWYTDEALTQAFEATTITADTTVYVKWTDAGNYTLVSEGSYGFEYNAEGGYWANNNQGVDSTSASIKITALDGPYR